MTRFVILRWQDNTTSVEVWKSGSTNDCVTSLLNNPLWALSVERYALSVTGLKSETNKWGLFRSASSIME
jgi:hypothetical protein